MTIFKGYVKLTVPAGTAWITIFRTTGVEYRYRSGTNRDPKIIRFRRTVI